MSKADRLLMIMVFVCMFAFSGAAGVVQARAAEPHLQGIVNCDIQQNPCKQKLADTTVVLDINPKPVRAMTDLEFTITLSGKQPVKPPYIDLGMPGMKMGPNRVSLKPAGKDVFEGTGVIVRCPSGKRVWKAVVTLPDMGSVEFVFDVVY
ncbi:hypothetical protein ACFL7E_07080 [Thermodesulfobacteriota bacterium]